MKTSKTIATIVLCDVTTLKVLCMAVQQQYDVYAFGVNPSHSAYEIGSMQTRLLRCFKARENSLHSHQTNQKTIDGPS